MEPQYTELFSVPPRTMEKLRGSLRRAPFLELHGGHTVYASGQPVGMLHADIVHINSNGVPRELTEMFSDLCRRTFEEHRLGHYDFRNKRAVSF